ncbi:hypothetical protein, partial [Rhizobium tibeticum]|uniref:hypothetical protein n=1 Tax=Rhizobium tibeticum TaxID=501024 RepID=UPI001ABF104B
PGYIHKSDKIDYGTSGSSVFVAFAEDGLFVMGSSFEGHSGVAFVWPGRYRGFRLPFEGAVLEHLVRDVTMIAVV